MFRDVKFTRILMNHSLQVLAASHIAEIGFLGQNYPDNFD